MPLSPFDTFQSRFVTYLLNFPRITESCVGNTYVIWQGIDYKLPEDDTIVSKYVGV